MKRFRIVSILWCAVWGLASTDATAKDWIKAESEHFVAFSDIGETRTRDYLRELESFKFLAEMLLGSSRQSAVSAAKFTMYFLSDNKMLDVVRPGLSKNYAGVYFHCSEGALNFGVMQETMDSSNGDPALVIAQHEYAHHLMFSHLAYFVPRWYVEGFADYLSTVVLRRGKFDVGAGNGGRIYTLTDQRGWIDFRILLDTKKYMEQLKNKKVDEDRFYAQSWLLTHYMLADSDRTKAFNQYFEKVGRGGDPIATFESTTGIEVNKLESILKRYYTKLALLRVGVPEIPESSIVISKLASEQNDYILENAALQTCPNQDQGKQILEKLRAMRNKHAKEIEFRLTIARAELLYGDNAALRADLEDLVLADPLNFTAHYLLGRTYFEISNSKNTEADLLERAKQELINAYKLDKFNAPNMYYLARTLNATNEGDAPSKSLANAASGATYLMRSVYEYAILAADISMRSGNREQAIRSLQPFACNPHNPTQAAGVSRIIAALSNGKSFFDAMNTYNDTSDQN